MCSECDDRARKIARYKGLIKEGFDILTTDRIRLLVAELERQQQGRPSCVDETARTI